MFSCFSDIIRNHSEYQNPRIRRILWNTTRTNKIATKALSAILDAMKLMCSPPADSSLEYGPNNYSDLEESKADVLSYSHIKELAITWQGCIGRTYFASDLFYYFYFVTPST